MRGRCEEGELDWKGEVWTEVGSVGGKQSEQPGSSLDLLKESLKSVVYSYHARSLPFVFIPSPLFTRTYDVCFTTASTDLAK